MQPITLYYAHDILCGWCYGFSENLLVARTNHPDIRWESLCGVMVPKNQAKPLSHMAEYLLEAIPRLEEMTGVSIGEPFIAALKDGTRLQHSETTARFLAWIKETRPELQFDAIRALQKGVFHDGLHPNEPALMEQTLEALNLAKDSTQPWNDASFDQDRRLLQDWGVQGYPTLVAEKNGQLYLLCRGYIAYETLHERLEHLKKNA